MAKFKIEFEAAGNIESIYPLVKALADKIAKEGLPREGKKAIKVTNVKTLYKSWM